ncbi:MAG: hypothetical protein WCK11_01185 [Candidatus Falkowbacteria bacterium]
MQGDFVIDLTRIYAFFDLPADEIFWRTFIYIGWIPIAITLLWGFFEIWVLYLNNKWFAQQKFIFLAIDIPQTNMQSPKAVENFFTYLAGAHSSLNLIDMYWDGKFQLSFSLEIVSMEGYTQFVIRTPEQFRQLVESGIYSQYPDAEITEINDYTIGFPRKFPDEEYDVWGGEFIMAKNSAYPIKTYKDFEHIFGEPETTFRDPMASLMDLCGSLGTGEYLWYQIILIPIDFSWVEIGAKEISKILKEKSKVKVTLANKIIDGMVGLVDAAVGTFLTFGAEAAKTDDSLKMMNLKPQEKKQIEMIQEKISKLGFKFKIRMVYMARKEVKNNPKVVNGFVGFMKQFAYNDLNNLKPDSSLTATTTSYMFKDSRLIDRKNRIVNNYMNRSGNGRTPGYMNIEELSTIWHFPIDSVVKAPLVQKASGRKAEAPITLPLGMMPDAANESDVIFQVVDRELKTTTPQTTSASELDEDIFDITPRDDVSEELFLPSHAPQAPTQSVQNKSTAQDVPPPNLPFV